MNKLLTRLPLAVLIAAVITGLTFLVPTHNAKITCFAQDTFTSDHTTQVTETTNDSAPTPAVERGFPLQYYREAFPSTCIPTNGQLPSSNFRLVNLVGDWLIWTALTSLITFALIKIRAMK